MAGIASKLEKMNRFRVYFFKDGRPHFSSSYKTREQAENLIKSQLPNLMPDFVIIDIQKMVYSHWSSRTKDWVDSLNLSPDGRKLFRI
jgi:hypothetical protein